MARIYIYIYIFIYLFIYIYIYTNVAHTHTYIYIRMIGRCNMLVVMFYLPKSNNVLYVYIDIYMCVCICVCKCVVVYIICKYICKCIWMRLCTLVISQTLTPAKGHQQIWEGPITCFMSLQLL